MNAANPQAAGSNATDGQAIEERLNCLLKAQTAEADWKDDQGKTDERLKTDDRSSYCETRGG